MTRRAFHYYPPDVADRARTYLLDWNVAKLLVSLYDGRRFENAPEYQDKLRDLAARFPDNGYAISGFAASEPEVRTSDSTRQDAERMFHRAAKALCLLEQGHSRFDSFLAGAEIANNVLSFNDGPRVDSRHLQKFADLYVRPAYVILLKAFVLQSAPSVAEEKIDDFRFWLDHSLQYRPSREVWLGILLLAGTARGRSLAIDMLKLGKRRSPAERLSDLWGASWDVFYTRLAGFGQDETMWPEAPRPFVFVTDDTKLYAALSHVELVDIVPTAHGTPMGRDYLPLDDLIREDLRDCVDRVLRVLNENVMFRRESPGRIIKKLVKNSRHEARLLRSEFLRTGTR